MKFIVACLVVAFTANLCAAQLGFNAGDLEQWLIDTEIALSKGQKDFLNPVDWFLQDFISMAIGQRPSNENGTKGEFKSYALLDNTNDEAAFLNAHQIILRSGFRYEQYDAIADDGYVTGLTRIINPFVDRLKLRKPPVLMEHGGTIDPTAYIIASSIQHHPEPWPRLPGHGPFTSWNRSLAFVLANHGFDVWLAETRGANDNNKRKVASRIAHTIRTGKNSEKNMTIGENIVELLSDNDYWSFTQDDIINHELKSHMDAVTELTGSKKMHLFTFSLSTPSSLAFLSIRPDYARRVQGYVSMAPIISGEGVSLAVKLVFQGLCPFLPDKVGNLLLTDILFTQPFRTLLVAFSYLKIIRYSLVKAVVTFLFGPSAKYQTLLELNTMGHLLRHLSFRELKQMCQQQRANQLQKFDYGPIKNKLVYNSTTPPVYDLSNLQIKDWIVVSAANDMLATMEMVDYIYKHVNPKPIAHIIAPGFNHLDLIAGFNNDKYVNHPILNYLIELSNEYLYEHEHPEHDHLLPAASARNFDISKLMPPEFKFDNITGRITNITETLTKPDELIQSLQKGILSIFENFSKTFKFSPEDLFGPKKEETSARANH